MAGLVAVIYGIVAYGFTLFALLYLIGFIGNLIVPKSIDFRDGRTAPPERHRRYDADRSVCSAAQCDGASGLQALVDAGRATPGGAQHLCNVRQFCAADPVLAVAAYPRACLDRA